MARVASRLCFCRVVLRDAVERKLRGTHHPYYVKTSSYGMNAPGLCVSIHRTALSALAYVKIYYKSAGHPPSLYSLFPWPMHAILIFNCTEVVL